MIRNGKFTPVNWNTVPDEDDLTVWKRLTDNFWLPEKIPMSNDVASWETLTDKEKLAVKRVLAGLTLLDTLQGGVAAPELMKDATTQHEEAVYGNISFMEFVHAKSYSTIFSTLCSTEEINEIMRWVTENENLQYKAKRVYDWYTDGGPLRKKAASVILESFLFYSGFYLPLKWAARGKLNNTADIISLILRDEAIHGYYIGYKFQQAVKELSRQEADDLEVEIMDLIMDLYENELEYTELVYDGSGWTEDVKMYLRYNANKALQNLGYPAMFPADRTMVSQEILAALSPDQSTNHDFFSGSGSSYIKGDVEETEDEDWDF